MTLVSRPYHYRRAQRRHDGAEQRAEEDLGGSGRDISDELYRHLSGGTTENHKELLSG